MHRCYPIALLASLFFLPVAGFAEDFTVPGDFDTIQEAINAASDGDTITVLPGDYPEDLWYSGKNITIQSIDPTDEEIVESTTIQQVIFLGSETTEAVLSGFQIDGTDNPSVYCGTAMATISDCIILNYGHNGSNDGITGCGIIERCRIEGCSRGVSDSEATVQDTIIRDCSLGFGSFSGEATNCLIEGGYNGFAVGSGSIRNCTIIGQRQKGVWYGDFTISNSIIRDQLYGPPLPEGFACTYSIVEGGYDGEGNLDADPLFVDQGHWEYDGIMVAWQYGTDYRLQSDSPAINAGDPDFIPPADATDLGGDPRFLGGRIDMGPYEFQGMCEGGDFDGDGIPDVCDPDIDNDGVLNPGDDCDFTPLGTLVDDDGRPRGDLDSDCDADLDDYAIFAASYTGPLP